MRHFDEATLELYVLGSKKVVGLRDEIAAHLGECRGCRTIVHEMTASYQNVEQRFRKMSESDSVPVVSDRTSSAMR